jgi:hypothetical protein
MIDTYHWRQADGSILFRSTYTGPMSKFYTQDADNPKLFKPLIEPCVHRRISLRTLECGQTRDTWNCLQQCNKKISVKDCYECQLPKT